jgi:hypothetical protein
MPYLGAGLGIVYEHKIERNLSQGLVVLFRDLHADHDVSDKDKQFRYCHLVCSTVCNPIPFITN